MRVMDISEHMFFLIFSACVSIHRPTFGSECNVNEAYGRFKHTLFYVMRLVGVLFGVSSISNFNEAQPLLNLFLLN